MPKRRAAGSAAASTTDVVAEERAETANGSAGESAGESAAGSAKQPAKKRQKTHHPVLAFFITCNPNKKRDAAAVKPPEYDETDLFFLGYIQHLGVKKNKLHWHAVVQFRTKKTYEQVKAWYGCNWIKVQSLKDYAQALKYLTDGHQAMTDYVSWGRYHTGTFRNDLEFAIHCAKRGKTQQYARQKRTSLYSMRKETLDQIWKDYAPKPDFGVSLKYDWQHEFVAMIDTELAIVNKDDMDWRTIHYVYNRSGNAGKTAFTKYLHLHYDVFVPRPAKLADILYAYDGQRIVVLDVPMSTDDLFVAWGSLEQIKDGSWFAAKYNSQVRFRTCSAIVFIFSNHPAPETKYSEDRLVLHTI